MELYSMLYGGLEGREVWRRRDIGICMAESLCYSPGTITTLLTGCIYIKKKIQQKEIRHSLTPANPAFPDTQELKCEPPFSLSTEAALLRIKVVFS